MGDAARKTTVTEGITDEDVERLLKRLNILTDQRDALDELIKADKARLRAIMEERGDRAFESDYYGTVVFSPRRNFRVIDKGLLKKRVTKDFLVEGFKPTAALVDALAQKGISIDGMISIGVNEQFTYRRPTTAEAEERRRLIIENAKDRMAAKVNEMLKTLD